MTPEKIVKALIEANAAAVALAGTRMYDETMPEGTALPAIVWNLISDVREPPIRAGVGTQPTEARVQVNCMAHTVASCKTLAEHVCTACHLQSGTIASTTVMAIFCDLGAASYDPLVDIYMQPVDVLVKYLR